jgi:hypothetical protein
MDLDLLLLLSSKGGTVAPPGIQIPTGITLTVVAE